MNNQLYIILSKREDNMTEEIKQPETPTGNCKCKVITWIAGIMSFR
jgi:hypothetical protein